MCGGGDVKLLAAVATWMGVLYFLYILFVALVVLIGWMVGQIIRGGLKPRQVKKSLAKISGGQPEKPDRRGPPPPAKPGKMRTTFSFPVAVATAIVLLVVFRIELQLVRPKQPEQPQDASAHVRPAPPPA
jgi:hypothetical protein